MECVPGVSANVVARPSPSWTRPPAASCRLPGHYWRRGVNMKPLDQEG